MLGNNFSVYEKEICRNKQNKKIQNCEFTWSYIIYSVPFNVAHCYSLKSSAEKYTNTK